MISTGSFGLPLFSFGTRPSPDVRVGAYYLDGPFGPYGVCLKSHVFASAILRPGFSPVTRPRINKTARTRFKRFTLSF
jgi:hypothetical protein